MPSPDLITRARSAANMWQEVDAIQNACLVLAPAEYGLIEICKMVRNGRAPSAALLGVVAALVPDGKWLRSGTRPSGAWAEWSEWNGCYSEAPTPALALLIAILEAAGQTCGEVGNG